MKEELIQAINDMFIPTPILQDISYDIKYMRQMSALSQYNNEPICMLVTGESGTGKSEFIKHYKKKYPNVEEAERTRIPVLVSLIPKAKHPKPVVSQLLRDLGDPLDGVGGDSTALTHRLVTLLKGAGVELIILDEFQHLIETKSNQVVYDIADFIKTLVSKSKIPVVLFGLPWSSYVLTVNSQLERRFTLSHDLINYTLDTYEEFKMFLESIQKRLPIKVEFDLYRDPTAFRLFAGSGGNISNLMNKIIRPAAIMAVDNDEELLTNLHFAKALKRFSRIRDEQNPFLMDIENVEAQVQKNSSYWNPNAAQGDSRVVDMTFARVKIADISLANVFSRK